MRKFDFYEFAGILSPGAVVLFGLSQIIPGMRESFSGTEYSLGDFGIFIILAYVAGHLTQAIGNILEKIWWIKRGMPTDWIRTRHKQLISEQQLEQVPGKIETILSLDRIKSIESLGRKSWIGVTRQVYAAVASAGKAGRIDTFNGNYGLHRGIASALILVLITQLVVNGYDIWQIPALLVIGIILAVSRMHRFAKHYARELFVQFLQL